ncbi:unnamed protein product [Pleuronectes platessa]|uniref:Uncharacterized protein n=1 Tax=Pleuronectes platessa TaxID=8262 RepID=A0A9N7UTH2_PLEPL|nr:unnamed protein product [Pleuronectes platessa]
MEPRLSNPVRNNTQTERMSLLIEILSTALHRPLIGSLGGGEERSVELLSDTFMVGFLRQTCSRENIKQRDARCAVPPSYHHHHHRSQPPHSFHAPSYDRPAQDRPSFDRPSFDRPVYDRPSFDRPSHNRPLQERPIYERPPHERPPQDRWNPRIRVTPGNQFYMLDQEEGGSCQWIGGGAEVLVSVTSAAAFSPSMPSPFHLSPRSPPLAHGGRGTGDWQESLALLQATCLCSPHSSIHLPLSLDSDVLDPLNCFLVMQDTPTGTGRKRAGSDGCLTSSSPPPPPLLFLFFSAQINLKRQSFIYHCHAPVPCPLSHVSRLPSPNWASITQEDTDGVHRNCSAYKCLLGNIISTDVALQ